MKRFFGIMPSDEVERECTFKDKNGYNIRVQAGKNGWTVIYADSSTNYADNVATTDENFETALKIAEEQLGCKLILVYAGKYDIYNES